MTDRMFPIQDGDDVTWEQAEKAYETYAALFGTGQSLERLAERGGFGKEEFESLYAGKNPATGKKVSKGRATSTVGKGQPEWL